MSAVMDDIARIIARRIPRRQALRLVGGVVGGTIAAALGKAKGLGSWAAQVGGASVATSPKCGRGQFACLRALSHASKARKPGAGSASDRCFIAARDMQVYPHFGSAGRQRRRWARPECLGEKTSPRLDDGSRMIAVCGPRRHPCESAGGHAG